MTHFCFFSKDPYEVVVNQLHDLNLGEVENVLLYEEEDTGFQYIVCYRTITCPTFAEMMREESGERKLIYGENEHGYPIYWKIWW
jgi:hypothetical protein